VLATLSNFQILPTCHRDDSDPGIGVLATLSNFQILPTCHRDDSDPGISEMVTPGVRHVTADGKRCACDADQNPDLVILMILVFRTLPTTLILTLRFQEMVTPRCGL